MKGKRIILMMLVVLVAIGGLSCAVLWLQKSKGAKAHAVGNFDLSKYQWEIKTFPSDRNVGQVDDKDAATEKAKSLWLEKYGADDEQLRSFIGGRKIEVAYDSKEECWHIYGTLPPNTLGGVPHVLVRKSGEVLAVWMDD